MPDQPDLTEQLQQALTLHQAGRLPAARERYEALLRLRPGYPPALHLLGLLAVTEGRIKEGIGHYEACLRSEPGFAAAWTNLGNALLADGRAAEAVAAHQRAVTLAPGLAEAYCNLGQALQAQGRSADAVAALQRAVELKPGLAEAHNNLGSVHKAAGELEQAEAAYRQALVVRPEYAEAWYNLGNVRLARRQPAAAEEAYARALALAPRHAAAHNNRGQALKELGRLDEARAAFATALTLKPEYAEAQTNLGNVLQAERRWEEAIAAHRRALAWQGDLVEAWSNLGNALMALNRTGEALAAYREARRRRPAAADLAYNEGLAHLLQGDFRSGWEGYERRWEMGDLRRRPVQNRPAWDGKESLSGRSIVVYAEQGLGDTLQFARYFPLLGERGAIVHAVVQKPLRSLLGRIRGVRSVGTAGEPWPECDFHCPLLSLPRVLGTELATIPAGTPYLTARPDRVEAAAGWLAAVPPPRIGVVWSGNPAHRNDGNRSLPIAALPPIFAAAGAQWVSLQKVLRPGEAEVLAASGVGDLSGRLQDFEDTAAVLAGLDLILTVDTAVAHLAGAMGRPAWILLPYAPDWRWLLEREDSPWYPSVRLFRQTEPGDWTAVLVRVAAELQRWRART
ncbi:MAG: tetratricopeptide repeat protein [Opitutales bacterium]